MINKAEETLRRANLALLSELVSIYNRNRLYNMFDNMKMQQLDDFNTAINEAIGLLKEAGVK